MASAPPPMAGSLETAACEAVVDQVVETLPDFPSPPSELRFFVPPLFPRPFPELLPRHLLGIQPRDQEEALALGGEMPMGREMLSGREAGREAPMETLMEMPMETQQQSGALHHRKRVSEAIVSPAARLAAGAAIGAAIGATSALVLLLARRRLVGHRGAR